MAPSATIPSRRTVPLKLTPAERKLILDLVVYVLDPDLEEQLLDTPASAREVALSPEELDDLAEHVAAHADHTTDLRLERTLYAIYDRIRRVQSALS